jgi:hypothetical protein
MSQIHCFDMEFVSFRGSERSKCAAYLAAAIDKRAQEESKELH